MGLRCVVSCRGALGYDVLYRVGEHWVTMCCFV